MDEIIYSEILEQGTEAWNQWRIANPGLHPDLSGEDLSELDLAGVNLSEVNLTDADFYGTDLRNANMKHCALIEADLSSAKLAGAELYKADMTSAFLTGADLTDAYLAEAQLAGADLRGAKLQGTELNDANLIAANLSEADLTGANMTRAKISDANLTYANLAEVNLLGLQYGSFHSMRGNYYGIRGLDSCYSNAIFVRDAKDRDYLDTLEYNIEQTPSPRQRRLKQYLFSAWMRIDYGRSLGKPAFYAFLLATGFGVIYLFDMLLGWGLMDYSGSAQSLLTPFYYSIVTYTTLGFGDITPIHWLGEIIVVTEVILGYTTLGIMLAILANRVARQS